MPKKEFLRRMNPPGYKSKTSLKIKEALALLVWLGRQDSNLANAGVKVPCLAAWRHPIAIRQQVKKNGVSDGGRTHAFQSHNLALYH